MTVAAQHPNLFRFLSAIDEDLAAKSRVQGCGFCGGGVLHSPRYPRKPRGGPMQAQASSLTTRQSFCCERCRRRTTPASVRFLGRRVYPGFVMVLLATMQSGVTDSRIDELRLSLGVTRRTLQRWRHWWRETFVKTQFWQIARGRFMPPIEHAALPAGLLERFQRGDPRSQLVLCLLFLDPLSVPGAVRLREGR